MARIVYGVSGEGSGHSSRARVVLEHLVKSGHTVKVVTYDRGLRHLTSDFDTFETVGLHIESVNNRVSPLKTLMTNLARLPDGHQRLAALRKEIFKGFKPHAVITDFEPMCAYLAHHYDLPLITIDNQHRLRYMRYASPPGLDKDRRLTVGIIRAMVPRPDVSLVTTFYFGNVTNQRTFLFPPLLRSQVLALKTARKNHILVYLTSGFEQFVAMLNRFPKEHFIIYGQEKTHNRSDNLEFKAPSTDGFLADLANCKGVMATAGFTLMTEALYLKKPYLALPMAGQFEQAINAVFLDKLQCGVNMYRTSAAGIDDFLNRLPVFEKALSVLPPFSNNLLLKKLDELLADKAEQANGFHHRRKQLSAMP